MRLLRSSRIFRLIVLPLTLLLFLPACQGWVGVETAPGILGDPSSPTRVTLKDGRQYVLGTTVVTADSLFGNRPGTPGQIDVDQSLRVALEDVRRIERKGTKGGSSAAVVVGLAAVVVGGVFFWKAMIGAGVEGALSER